MTEDNTLTHYETAELILRRLNNDPEWYGDIPGSETLARAQVHATLAVADLLRPHFRVGAAKDAAMTNPYRSQP